jgi:hypothetical protein
MAETDKPETSQPSNAAEADLVEELRNLLISDRECAATPPLNERNMDKLKSSLMNVLQSSI